jgi:DNA-binding response OmpR family regulator
VKTILVIDDDEYSLLLIYDLLNFYNFKVITAKNGSEGLLLAKTQSPDLIICALDLSQPNGYEVLRESRFAPTTANIPVLFLTVEIDLATRRHGLELGANGYIIKPLNLNQLLSAIRSILGE